MEQKKKKRSLALLSFLPIAFVVLFFLWKMFFAEKPIDFSLNSNGQTWAFHNNSNRLNIIYFGYTKCPDVCPMTMSFVTQAFNQLNEDEKNSTSFVFVSVDSEHETKESVSKFVKQFNERFIGLSGSKQEILQAMLPFAASYTVEQAPGTYLGYTISHPDKLFFVSSSGRILGSLVSPRNIESVAVKIKEYL